MLPKDTESLDWSRQGRVTLSPSLAITLTGKEKTHGITLLGFGGD